MQPEETQNVKDDDARKIRRERRETEEGKQKEGTGRKKIQE